MATTEEEKLMADEGLDIQEEMIEVGRELTEAILTLSRQLQYLHKLLDSRLPKP